MKSRTIGLAALVFAVPTFAHAEGLAVSAKAGSSGFGAEVTVRLTSKLNVRLGGAGFNYAYAADLSDVEYDTKLDLKGGAAAIDWHPSGGAFRISTGLLLHGNKLSGVGVPKTDVDIGDHTYQPREVGALSVSADYKRKAAPFVTLGLGNGAKGKRVFLSFEGGVAFTRNPSVTMSATGSAPGLNADLRIEESKVNEDLALLKIYPLVSVGIGIRF